MKALPQNAGCVVGARVDCQRKTAARAVMPPAVQFTFWPTEASPAQCVVCCQCYACRMASAARHAAAMSSDATVLQTLSGSSPEEVADRLSTRMPGLSTRFAAEALGVAWRRRMACNEERTYALRRHESRNCFQGVDAWRHWILYALYVAWRSIQTRYVV